MTFIFVASSLLILAVTIAVITFGTNHITSSCQHLDASHIDASTINLLQSPSNHQKLWVLTTTAHFSTDSRSTNTKMVNEVDQLQAHQAQCGHYGSYTQHGIIPAGGLE